MKQLWLVGILLLLPLPTLGSEPVAICLGDRSEWAPYTYWKRVDGAPDRKQLTGAATRLVFAALEQSGLQHEVSYMPWARVLLELERYRGNRKCELTWDASLNPERAKKFHYSVPLYRTSLGVFYSTRTFAQPPEIRQLSDLKRYRLCGVIGYNYDEFEVAEADIHRIHKVQQGLRMLSAGRCDLFPSAVEPVYGGVALGAYEIAKDVRSLRLPALQKTFYALVAKSSPRAEQLLEKLNHGITTLQASGEAEGYFPDYLPDGSGLVSLPETD